MTEKDMVRTSMNKEQDEKAADKRFFLRRAAAALGVVVAAGLTGRAITKSAAKAGSTNARSRSAEEDLRQQQIMADKQLVIMTPEEKQQMLDRIVRNHYRTVS